MSEFGRVYAFPVNSPGYIGPAAARPPVVRPLWSLPGPAIGALLAAAMITAPFGPWGSAIGRNLGHSTATTALAVITPYVLAMAAMVTPGYLLGRRWPTAAGVPALVLVVVASLVCFAAPGTAVMAVGQTILGLGAGTVIGVLLALSGQLDRGHSQARLVLGLALGAAFLLGPVVCGVLTQLVGWRFVFLVAVAVAGLALVATAATGIAMLVVRASQPSSQPGPVVVGGPAR